MELLVFRKHLYCFVDIHPDRLIPSFLLTFRKMLFTGVFDQLADKVMTDKPPVQEEFFDLHIFFDGADLHAGFFQDLSFAAFRI